MAGGSRWRQIALPWCSTAFTLASALCGLARSAESLIAFRILQGMTGGLMAPMAQIMLARATGKHMARIVAPDPWSAR